MESLFTGFTFFPDYKITEQRNTIFPVRILNEKGDIVDLCITQIEAKKKIERRKQALILLGFEPKNYEVVSNNKISEFDGRKSNIKYSESKYAFNEEKFPPNLQITNNPASTMKNDIQQLTGIDKVNYLFHKYKNKFPNSFFHTLLWNLFVEKTRKLNDAAFTVVIENGYTILVIADKGIKGYTPTTAVFETNNYDEASDICDELNQDVFGLDEKEAFKIIATTMHK